jgi:hypothetical protein
MAARGNTQASVEAHPLVGATLGVIERRYGLMTSSAAISIVDVVGVSGDLAVADRIAFIASMERRVTVTVVSHDGWFVACITDRPIEVGELTSLRAPEGAPRLMSLATDRGIRPTLGPLVA